MYHIDSRFNTLRKLPSMEVVELNDTAILILLELFVYNNTLSEIASKFVVDIETLQNDIHDLMSELREQGFDIANEPTLDVTGAIGDLSKVWTPTTPIIHIIQNCNSPCIMCDCWKAPRQTFHNLETLKPLFVDLADRGVHSLMISGGEPLMHPECREIIQFVKSLGVSVELNTNGILLHKNMWVLEESIDEIVISMDATDRETYKLIRGADKFELVWQNIQRIKDVNPNQSIGARVTLTTNFLNDLKQSISFLLERGVDFIGFSPLDRFSSSFSRYNNSIENGVEIGKKLLPKISDLKAIRDDLNDPDSDNHLAVRTFFDHQKIGWNVTNFIDCIDLYLGKTNAMIKSNNLCNFPFTSLVLDYDGELRCCFYSKSFGNIYSYHKVDWTAKNVMIDLQESGKCKDCRGKVFCG